MQCPESAPVLGSGSYVIDQPCSVRGDIVLSGDAQLAIESPNFVLDGSIRLSGSAVLEIRKSIFLIANHFALEHRIDAYDDARLEITDSTVNTNPGYDASLATQYTGHDRSVLRIENTEFSLKRSWFLGDFHEQSVLRTINSKYIPTEIYPHDEVSISIEGPSSDNGVWLEARPGSKVLLENIPKKTAPFNLKLGKGAPGWENVGYEVNVVNGISTFGVHSMPHSDVTIRNNGSPLTVAYSFSNIEEPQLLMGIRPFLENFSLSHQGRSLDLINAALEGFAWQIYSMNPALAAPAPVRIQGSTINEIGALKNGRVTVENCVLQWALIAALEEDSSIDVMGSTINSQTILVESNGVVRVNSSAIYGSLVQARDDGTIVLINTSLQKNVCHALCLPLCPPHADGGCNPFSKPGEDVRFLVERNGRILVAGIDPIREPLVRGAAYEFSGNAFLESASSLPYEYRLSYRPSLPGDSAVIASGSEKKRGATLGRLDTSALAAGDYVVRLELTVSGTVVASAEQPFRVMER
jgi:hypothetical protein